jgi:hypothetical protein
MFSVLAIFGARYLSAFIFIYSVYVSKFKVQTGFRCSAAGGSGVRFKGSKLLSSRFKVLNKKHGAWGIGHGVKD